MMLSCCPLHGPLGKLTVKFPLSGPIISVVTCCAEADMQSAISKGSVKSSCLLRFMVFSFSLSEHALGMRWFFLLALFQLSSRHCIEQPQRGPRPEINYCLSTGVMTPNSPSP